MPQPNTRVVVLGTPKADKDFDVFDAARLEAEREGEKRDKEATKLLRDLQRVGRDLRRGRLR